MLAQHCTPVAAARGEGTVSETFDALVIGSGFGGSVMACRLAQRGMRVLVLERGRRWSPGTYPRKPGDPWFFSVRHPHVHDGWLDVRVLPGMVVAQAAGVGGGSLAYSSVALEAHPSCFETGWPDGITHASLAPFYQEVARMLRVQALPDAQETARVRLTREGATRLGHADRFSKAPLAVSFSPDWHYGLDTPFDHRHSRRFVNDQGQPQGTCVHLGTCDIGCDVRAKNGLDITYLALAERHGCDVRPRHVVDRIEPIASGYQVSWARITDAGLVRGSAAAARVIVAAGSLGSTELLLRARDQHRTLPNLSRTLGHGWSPNANVLSMAAYPDAGRVQQSIGPTIASVVDFMDGAEDDVRFVVEDDGFPDLLMNALRAASEDGVDVGALLPRADEHAPRGDAARGLMLWLGAGVDAADGQLRLTRPWLPPFRRDLTLRWDGTRSRRVVDAIVGVHRRLTDATGGRLIDVPPARRFGPMLTLHPLGGCRMGTSATDGVVDHGGQVFGYPGLYVMDGAIVPVAIGRNPSHTIAALAERAADFVQ